MPTEKHALYSASFAKILCNALGTGIERNLDFGKELCATGCGCSLACRIVSSARILEPPLQIHLQSSPLLSQSPPLLARNCK
jgi:hypothetical protein